MKKMCLDCGSNTGPSDLQSDALPTELSRQLEYIRSVSTSILAFFLNKKIMKFYEKFVEFISDFFNFTHFFLIFSLIEFVFSTSNCHVGLAFRKERGNRGSAEKDYHSNIFFSSNSFSQ